MPSCVCWGIITYSPELAQPSACCLRLAGLQLVPASGGREVWFVSVDKTRWQPAGPLGRHLFRQALRWGESFRPFPQVPNRLCAFTGCSVHSAAAHRSPPFASTIYTMALGFQRGWKSSAAAMGMLAEPQQGGLGGSQSQQVPSECIRRSLRASRHCREDTHEPSPRRSGCWGCRGSRKKREVLSAPHRAWFHPH